MPESTSAPRSAFKGGLKTFEAAPEYTHNSLYLSGVDPEKVVRRVNQSGETHKQSLEASKTAKTLTQELFSKYGIRTPSYDIVQAPDVELNEPVVYIITDRIHGYTIADKTIPPEVVKISLGLFEDFYTSLVSYVGDKYAHGGDMLIDIDPHQFMLGHTATEPFDHIYLIDLDPLSARIEPLGQNKEHEDLIFSTLRTTYDCMRATEEMAGAKLTQAQENLRARLRLIPEKSKSGYYTQSIQPILEDLQKAA